MHILEKSGCFITIVGIDNHKLTGLPIVSCAAKFETNHGPVIGIFHEYAYHGKGKSIHAPGQLEHFGITVDDKSVQVGGKQHITMLDGCVLPLQVINGFSYLKTLGIPSDSDMTKYPHIIFIAPAIWDPSLLDHTHPDFSSDHITNWTDLDTDGSFSHDPYDWHGEYTDRDVQNLNILLDLPEDTGSCTPLYSHLTSDSHPSHPIHLHQGHPDDLDWSFYHPFFGWAPVDSIAATFKHTTQNGNIGGSHDYLKKHFKARNNVLNIPWHHEPVAMNTIFSNTPTSDHGGKMAQIFVGRRTLVFDAHGIKSTKQFVNTL